MSAIEKPFVEKSFTEMEAEFLAADLSRLNIDHNDLEIINGWIATELSNALLNGATTENKLESLERRIASKLTDELLKEEE